MDSHFVISRKKDVFVYTTQVATSNSVNNFMFRYFSLLLVLIIVTKSRINESMNHIYIYIYIYLF